MALTDKYWRGGSGTTDDQKGDFTRVNEVADTIDNAAAVDKGGGLVGIPITGHAFSADDPVTIAGTTNYNGVFKIISETVNEIVITATYVGETFAGTETAKTYLGSNWVVAVGSDGYPDLGVSYPLPADTMHFTGRATIATGTPTEHTAGLHYNCYGNMGSGPDDCQGVVVAAEFTGLIGKKASGVEAPLQLSLAAGKELIFRGNSEAYFMIKTASKVVPKVIFDSTSGILALSGVNDTNAVWTLIECRNAGTLELEEDTKYTDIYNYGSATIIINKNCPAGSVYTWGGTVLCDSPATNIKGYGDAAFTLGRTTFTNPEEDLDAAAVEWKSTGTLTWRAAGTITAYDQDGGIVAAVGSGDKQIGNSSDVWTINRGYLDLSAQKGLLTFEAGSTIVAKVANAVRFPAGSIIDGFTTGN